MRECPQMNQGVADQLRQSSDRAGSASGDSQPTSSRRSVFKFDAPTWPHQGSTLVLRFLWLVGLLAALGDTDNCLQSC